MPTKRGFTVIEYTIIAAAIIFALVYVALQLPH